MQLQKITKSDEATTTQQVQATRLLHLRIVPPPFFPQRLGARTVASTIPAPVHSNPNAANAGVGRFAVFSRSSCLGKESVALLRVRYGFVASRGKERGNCVAC